ncbi:aprataxin-like protein [Drosophila montana]|uniref:aprataxin-like protein n=1 Tax=Drosophila montana TaxID=40370 RepID=UPI00313B6C6E
MYWQTGLIKSLLDPINLIITTDIAVVIADKYPKARHHYLVLPKEDIASIFQLSKKHLPLLEELHLLAHNIIEIRGENFESFQIGFHAQPSMQRLHLHVISKDFVSSCLKTKKHWNSFNTSLFIPYETLYAQLSNEGHIQCLPKDIVDDLLARPLTCNQCTFVAKNMPLLKEHLQEHQMGKPNEVYRNNLTYQMQQGKGQLIETDLALVMKDAYPKAQYHFLVVPKEDIPNVCALTREHLPLLDHMMDLATQIIEQQKYVPSSYFLIGFKIDAFMNRIAMHVISNDFYSESMRRVKHWNSFNTDVFLTYQAVYALLRVQGSIEPMSAEKTEALRNTKLLRCNQCDFESESLVALKCHLFEHWKKREVELKIKQQVENVTRLLDEAKLEVNPKQELVDAPQAINESTSQITKESQNAGLQPSYSRSATNSKPDRQIENWRKNMGQQPTDLQQPAPNSNTYQNTHYKKGGGGPYHPQQGYVNFIPGQNANSNYQPPEFRQFNQQAANGPRPNSSPRINFPNSGSNLQQANANLNFNRHPNGQDPRFNMYRPNFSKVNSNNFVPPNGQHHQTRPRFNTVKQSTSMEQGSSAPRHNQTQNSFGSGPSNHTSNAMQVRPKFNPKPQHNQAQNTETLNIQQNQAMLNKPNAKPESQQSMGPIHPSVNICNPISEDQGNQRKGKGNPFKKKFVKKQNENPQKS